MMVCIHVFISRDLTGRERLHPWLGALVGGAGGAVAGYEIGKHNNNSDDR